MRHLRRQIHLAILSALGLLALLSGLVFHFGPPGETDRSTLDALELVLGEWLPGPDRPRDELQTALERLGERLHADLSVRDPGGALVASVGDPIDGDPGEPRWRARRGGASGVVALPGGRLLQLRLRNRPGAESWLAGLALVMVAVGSRPGPWREG